MCIINREELRIRKKEKRKEKVVLSFDIEEEEEEPEEESIGKLSVYHHNYIICMCVHCAVNIKRKKYSHIGKNPFVDTSFLPDRDREVRIRERERERQLIQWNL